MMEISKALQEEILSVQNKLKNAIRDHQICVMKLKDDPNNADILDRIREIHLHIVSLGRWQKQVVQRLRKEVESFKVENALNGARISVASLLGLNNNNHITNNNEVTLRRAASVESVKIINGLSESRSSSKEDYEDNVRNGDLESPLRDSDNSKERRSSSVELASGDDDIVEVPISPVPVTNSTITIKGRKPKLLATMAPEQQSFLGRLGLITITRLLELQSKRAERKRRSTANSHFVYSNWEAPMKRKRHAYLQSLGNAPQTRQTTARLNGPSPPPTRSNIKSNSSSTGSRGASTVKSSEVLKPNILRNGDGKLMQQKEFCSKSFKQESGMKMERQEKLSTGKAVHIPGLPSGLTIERIENDSTVCITCRNPGTLTVCEYCSAKFHVSCHTISPASSCYCPKCATRFRNKGLNSVDLEILRHEMKAMKKEKEAAATAYATRAFGKAGEDSEVFKTSGGLYKADAVQTRQLLTAAALGINQLPSSTFLIPIATSSSVANDSLTVTAVNEPLIISPSSEQGSTPASTSQFSFDSLVSQHSQQQSSILLSHLSQPNTITTNNEPRLLRQSQEAISHGQSLLVIEKNPRHLLGKRRWSADRLSSKPKPTVSVLDYEWSNRKFFEVESKKPRLALPKSSNYVTVEVICRDEDRVEFASENSGDYPNDSESPKVPDVVNVESPSTDESKHQEPEVHNVSSGSSEIQLLNSPQPEAKSVTSEHFKTDTESNGSAASVSSFHRDLDIGINDIDSCDSNKDYDDFFNSVFPGKYGYKIEIVEVECSSSSSCDQSSDGQCERLEHVKLEEAHISAPLRTELEDTQATEEDEEGDRSFEENSLEKLTTVPDNKSDDAIELDEDDDLDTSQPSL